MVGIVLLLSSCSKRNPPIAGYWTGQLTVKEATLRLGLDLSQTAANGYSATFDSLDQGARGIPVPQVTYADGNLHLGLPAIGATFDGKVAGGGKQIDGTWKQLGFSAPLVWRPGPKPPVVSAAEANQAYTPRPGSDVQGIWKGTLVIGPVRLRLLFKLAESADGKFSGVLDSLDQGAHNISLTSVSYTRPTLDIEIKQIGGTFDGKVDVDAKQIVGEWEQLGRTTPLTLTRADPAEFTGSLDLASLKPGDDSGPQGSWAGALSVRGMTLRLIFKVAREGNGQWRGWMDSVDQGVHDLPASQVTFTNDQLRMEWQGINGSFDGDLTGGKLEGEWRQMGASMPLVLTRTNLATPGR
jgi:hypothetical protein